MRYSKLTGGLVLAVALLASTAFAGNKAVSMDLTSGVQINGKQLPAGEYQLKWEGNGPQVQVQFLRNRKVVATAPAKLEQVTTKFSQNSAVIENSDGSPRLAETRFAGKNYKLVFGGEAQAQNGSGNGSSGQTNR